MSQRNKSKFIRPFHEYTGHWTDVSGEEELFTLVRELLENNKEWMESSRFLQNRVLHLLQHHDFTEEEED